MPRANFHLSLTILLCWGFLVIVACGTDSSLEEDVRQSVNKVQEEGFGEDFQALDAEGQGSWADGRGDSKKSETLGTQGATIARAHLVFETALARMRQKNQEVEMAREVAEAALAEVDAVEMELLAAQSEFRQAEQALKSLGVDRPREASAVSDIALFRKVQGEILQAKPLAQVAISVEVKMGVVTLRGLVPSVQVRTLALNIAERVNGVRRVDNLLTLSGKEDSWRDR